ncbi:MAG: hypothetical protein HYY26_04665 [Acidobacteria bacterium]|nr:hypothetical protein [Acidobacteriota bacterium]
MLRRTVLAAAALLLLPLILSAYTVVLKDGRRIEARSPYTIEGNVAVFVGADGSPYRIPLEQIDRIATLAANRQERPRSKVWTNDDIEQLKQRGPAPVAALGEAAPPAEAAAEGEPATPGGEGQALPPKEETREYWQERLKPLQEQLAAIDQEINRLRSGQGRAVSNAVDINTDAPGVDVADTIRRLEQRRTQVQQQIAALQDEARRRGIPPGWVR